MVISDRIRENLRKLRRESLEKIINMSINQTLSRTVITTGTSLLVLIALLVFGGGVIRPFAFALLIGFIMVYQSPPRRLNYPYSLIRSFQVHVSNVRGGELRELCQLCDPFS